MIMEDFFETLVMVVITMLVVAFLAGIGYLSGSVNAKGKYSKEFYLKGQAEALSGVVNVHRVTNNVGEVKWEYIKN